MKQILFLVVLAATTCILGVGGSASRAETGEGGQAGGVSQDRRMLAEKGDASSQAAMGSMYAYGRGVPLDYQEAVNWYHKAAAQGNPEGLDGLGVLYYHGWGVKQDYPRAFELFQSAAQKGYAHAEYNVGMMYEYGEGVPRNPGRAEQWYEKAANDGDIKAQNALGKGLASGAEKLRYVFLGIVSLASIGAIFFPVFPKSWPYIGQHRVSLLTLGLAGALFVGLSAYGIANNNMRFSPYASAFAICKLLLAVIVIALGIPVVFRKRGAECVGLKSED
jgi:Sel1 repeat